MRLGLGFFYDLACDSIMISILIGRFPLIDIIVFILFPLRKIVFSFEHFFSFIFVAFTFGKMAYLISQ